MLFKRAFIFSSLVILIFSLGFLSGYFTTKYLTIKDTSLPILIEAYEILQNNGIKELPPSPKIEYGMIHGMVQAYGDPYTIFVEPVQHELEVNSLQGSYGGIGVDIERDVDGWVRLYPYSNGPAKNSGIIDGDILIRAGDNMLNPEISLDEVTSWLRGPVGEKVEILILRELEELQYEYQIEFSEFPIPSVSWHIDNDDNRIGVISISTIAASTVDELRSAVSDLTQDGARAYILDLRDNFGGLLSAGVDIASLFLDRGIVIQEQYRDKSVETFMVENPGPYLDLPMVVIIGPNTASAAEIVAGALKKHGRALVLGNPSMGKDSIQMVFELSDGSSMHVTAARWWIPNLQPAFGEEGLQPDIIISPSDPESDYDTVIQGAKAILVELITP
ncbi:MAG: hypothetical protein JSV61_01205 [Anaerolineales bacterium]|nr:MAG: hypothetical protein JSV61_01205 [Anaerolineales bacterium]